MALAILAMEPKPMCIDVTAEGVETAAQLALLRAQGCGAEQGALLGDAMPADAVQDFLQGKPPPQRQPERPPDARWALAPA